MPGDESFAGAERANLSVLFAGGVYKKILSFIVAKLEDDGASQIWKQGVLLELVGHDRHITKTFSSNAHSLLRVTNCMVNSQFAR